jgi:alkylation response protein AidB-like acyl-CoA dehydrogenase
MVLPWPRPPAEERERVRGLISSLREAAEGYDARKAEEERWVGDEFLRDLGERGLMGLFVPEEYGGQGLSQTGYCRVFEAVAQIDSTLPVILGVHQSIGLKGIALFGTNEQKERFLPDLASGRKLAAFALTEPGAGSDAYHLESRAVRQSDGSWRLNGEKRWIGNGDKGSVIVTFARAEVDGRDRHIALILEKGMEGFEVGHRYDTMGLRANDLRHLYFNDVRVPPENVLGEPGEGFKIAMHILNNGRMSLATGSVGGAKTLLDGAIEHVTQRRQFDRRLADFELEAMCYLTTGLVDRGVPDYSLESAMGKVAGSEFLWYQANRVLQLKGGEGYMRDQFYEKVLRDIRIFPIFEGANDVLQQFVALSGMKPLGEQLEGLSQLNLREPVGALGVVADYVGGRVRREIRPDRVTRAHADLDSLAEPLGDQVKRLRDASEKLLRKHGRDVMEQGFQLKRVAAAAADIYAQFAVLSRVTHIYEDQGVEVSGQERYIAETFVTRAAQRVKSALDHVESNDDERTDAIAKLTYRRGEYGFSLFQD